MTPTRKAKGAAARATTKPATVKRGAKRESTIPESGTTETQRASRRPAQALREAPRTRSTAARKAAASAPLVDEPALAEDAAPPSSVVASTPDVPVAPVAPVAARRAALRSPAPVVNEQAAAVVEPSPTGSETSPLIHDGGDAAQGSIETEATRPPADPAEIDALAQSLGDVVVRYTDAWVHYLVVRQELGVAGVQLLVSRAREVEAAGGMTVVDGERKRTLGGIFFALAREQLGPLKWRALRRTVRQTAQKSPTVAPPKPARPEPEVLVRRRGVW